MDNQRVSVNTLTDRVAKGNVREPIQSFDSFVYRAPILPYNQLRNLLSKIDDFSILDSMLIKEALFLAAPDFLSEIERLRTNQEDTTKAKLTLLKYLLRMSTRCTPFGLFSGSGIGRLGDKNQIILKTIDKYQSFTRFDNNYLCSLIRTISAMPEIQDQLKYKVNTSLYPAGNNYRYIEYFLVNQGRVHVISSVERNEYLDSLIQRASQWVSIQDLSDILVKDDITRQEANEYILDLIQNQVLVSELDPGVSGEDPLDKLCKQMNRFEQAVPGLALSLSITKELISKLDSDGVGRNINSYRPIIDMVSKIVQPERLKYLFQSNLLLEHQEASVSQKSVDRIIEGLHVLNKLTPYAEHPFLTKFKEEFVKRFDAEERPLMETLDTEIGIGFGEMGNLSGDINPLLNGIVGGSSMKEVTQRVHAPVLDYLQYKYEEYLLNLGTSYITLKDEELSRFKENWDTVPDTFSALVKFTDGETIMFDTAGGTSASSIISRYGNSSEQINTLIAEISKKEDDLAGDSILAEIVHLPESRSGNVLNRPRIRNYEIPLLANPAVSEECIIPVSDIMVSVHRGRIWLRSKKYNKEIKPRLTTALAFTGRALPVYQFLCFAQLQNRRGMLALKWGDLENKNFLPRVMYKNLILSPAMWNIQPSQFNHIGNSKDIDFTNQVSRFRDNYKIPDRVLLQEGDNRLFIDFNHEASVKLLFSIVKEEPFRLVEFIENESSSLIRRDEDVFTNELIFFFHKCNVAK